MREFSDLLVYLIVAPLLTVIGWLPRQLGLLLCLGILKLVLLCMPRLKGVGMRNLEIAFPELPFDEREAIFKRSCVILAENLLSFCRIPSMNVLVAREEYDCQEVLALIREKEANDAGTGVICVTFHFGASEGLIQALALHYTPFSILARGFGLPHLDRWWNRRREKFGNRVFARKGGFMEVVRRVAAGHNVAVLVDQNVKRNYASFVNFFGMQVSATKPMALAALKTGAPAIFGVPVQTAPGCWKVWARALPHPSEFPGTEDEQAQQFLQRIHDYGEEVIRQYPDHWFWIHRRFKTRPEGEPETVYAGI